MARQAPPPRSTRSQPLRNWLQNSPGWLSSVILHGIVLLALALWALPIRREQHPVLQAQVSQLEDLESTPALIAEAPPTETEPVDAAEAAAAEPEQPAEPETVSEPVAEVEPAAETTPKPDPATSVPEPTADQSRPALPVSPDSGLAGRSGAARATLLARGGGTPQSEAAVQLALQWLAAHQDPDGSWSLDHAASCGRACGDPGSRAPARNGATALAVLPFLGAGHTHRQPGEFRDTVRAGLDYLVRSMQPHGGLTDEGGKNMYSHGLAAIALCEAYAMSRDRRLRPPAQAALDFIRLAQHSATGGWGYPSQPQGTTSVLGFQMLAIKSGRAAKLHVADNVLAGAKHFLDNVQMDGGAYYGYQRPERQQQLGRTSIGLLSRMLLGWQREQAALRRGVEFIQQRGPSQTDFYANYYATQVVFQYWGGQGPHWDAWNGRLRDQLVASQESRGHAQGSWFRRGGVVSANSAGGRLYCTSMAALTLEVYYRYLPIYDAGTLAWDGAVRKPVAGLQLR